MLAASGPPTVPSKVAVMVAVVKEASSLEDWNTTPEAPSVALDGVPCGTVWTSAAESMAEPDGVDVNGVGFEDEGANVDVAVGTGPAMNTAEDVGDAEAASLAVDDVEKDSDG